MEIFLDASNARQILKARPNGVGRRAIEVSLDLNLAQTQLEASNETFQHGDQSFAFEPLEAIATGGRKCFRKVDDEPWAPLEVFDGKFHQLVATSRAPSLEIDGVQMHRTAEIEPFQGALDWARAVVRPGDFVLDTCGGLGYTAIHAARLGASRVLSTELSESVIRLRELNPWSRLERGLALELQHGDIFALLARLPSGSLDSAIHDPPRYSLAPELYSGAFYVRLHDALKPGGRCFHYTGAPYSRGRGRDFLGGVVSRLGGAGFRVTMRPELQGLVAVKRHGR